VKRISAIIALPDFHWMPVGTMDDLLYRFSPFGIVHATAVVATIVAAVFIARRRRQLPTDRAKLRLDYGLAIFALALTVINHTYEFLPGRYDVYRSLPLHICDFVGVYAPLAVLTRLRVFRAMLYYWGLGLSTQAMFTPELQYGVASFTFWIFWLPHAMIVILAVYDLAALGFRPGWKDFLIGVATLAIYVALIIPVDLWLNVNYGYVGKGVPGQPSVIDFLGPWPRRLIKLVLAVLVFLALMTLPWEIARRMRSRRPAEARPEGVGVATRPADEQGQV